MKTLLSIITLCIGVQCVSAQATNPHERLMERAHPTPRMMKKYGEPTLMVPVVEESVLPSSFLNVNMIAQENDQLPAQNESSIAINPLNPANMIGSAVDYRGNSSTWAYYSNDSGRTWKNITLGAARPGWRSSNDPSVCFDHKGKGYLCYGGFNRQGNAQFGENGVFISSTTDGGATWSMRHTAVIIHTGQQTADSAFEDKYYVHADTAASSPHRGHLYIPWKRVINRDSSTTIVITKSTDEGATWSTPVAVSDRFPGTSEATTFGQSFPLARTGPDGSVHVVWNSGTESSLRYARSTDGGATWTAPRVLHTYNPFGVKSVVSGQSNSRVKGVVRAECYPTLAIDNTGGPRNGWMYLTWAADNPYPNVYFSRSTDNGNTWSTPVIAHSDTTNDQFWSWITLDPTNGDVAIMYSDSREDPNNILVHTYVSWSTDGGSTWLDRRVGDGINDLRRNPFDGNTFAGDYSGCDMRDGVVYPSWVDMRNTFVNSADNDVYTARVDTRAPAAPRRFLARTVPIRPTTIALSWDRVTSLSFGQPLPEGAQISIARDGQRIALLSPADTAMIDTGLVEYRRYTYTLDVVANNRYAAQREASAFAGGARQPAAPTLRSVLGSGDTSITGRIVLPTRRLDSVTALVNLRALNLFAAGTKEPLTVLTSDTGRIVEPRISMNERGWYPVWCSVEDAASNASPSSDTLWTYTGAMWNQSYTETYARDPRYYVTSGPWGRTTNFARSAPASFAHAPAGPYAGSRRDTCNLYPAYIGTLPPETALTLTMYVAAFIDPSDTMFLEASSKGFTGTYSTLDWWNASRDARWNDTTKGDDAWRAWSIRIPSDIASDTMHLRLRFRSNASRQSDGFYIDDVRFELVSRVDEEPMHIAEVWPNPAGSQTTLTMHSDDTISDVLCVSASGERMPISWSQAGRTVRLDLRSLAAGMYSVIVECRSTRVRATVSVVR